MSPYTEIDILRTKLKKERELTEILKKANITTVDELTAYMAKYSYYKNKANKYTDNVKRLAYIIDWMGRKKYDEIMKNAKY